MENNKIFVITLTLTKSGFKWGETVWESLEKDKIFVSQRVDRYGELTTKHIKKDSIMKVDSNIISSTHFIGFHIRCFEQDKEKAKSLLLERVLKEFYGFKNNIDELDEQVKKFIPF